jgi:hypothetical protein
MAVSYEVGDAAITPDRPAAIVVLAGFIQYEYPPLSRINAVL